MQLRLQARRIREERAWHLLPILGDALEDAGCTNDDLLRLCHGIDGFPSLPKPGPVQRFGSLLRSLLPGWWIGVPLLGNERIVYRLGAWQKGVDLLAIQSEVEPANFKNEQGGGEKR
jgi:hypothetical protein